MLMTSIIVFDVFYFFYFSELENYSANHLSAIKKQKTKSLTEVPQ